MTERCEEFAEGMEKGRGKGRIMECKIIASNMIAMGLGEDIIARATGVSKSDIESLKKRIF